MEGRWAVRAERAVGAVEAVRAVGAVEARQGCGGGSEGQWR